MTTSQLLLCLIAAPFVYCADVKISPVTSDSLIQSAVNILTIQGEYLLEYSASKSESPHSEHIKEWMTTSKTRVEVVGDHIDKDKRIVDQKDLWIVDKDKLYYFNGLDNTMTVTPDKHGITTSFSNPLFYKWWILAKTIKKKSFTTNLTEISSPDYFHSIETSLDIQEKPDHNYIIRESNNPSNKSTLSVHFAGSLPDFAEWSGERIFISPKEEQISKIVKFGSYKVTSTTAIDINNHKFSIPESIEWKSGSDEKLVCTIKILKFDINKIIDEDYFVPDMAMAEKIEDYSPSSSTQSAPR